MKKIILLCSAIAMLAACGKKTEYVTVPTHDTTTRYDTIYTPKQLIGTWYNDAYSNRRPTFTTDSFTLGGLTCQYLASSDTIYAKFSNTTIDKYFGYKISENNDTLVLSSTAFGIVKYYRII